jgi:hypothetical protein
LTLDEAVESFRLPIPKCDLTALLVVLT